MPAVAIEIDVADPALAYLGELGGWQPYETLGRLAALRARCVELKTDVPGEIVIRTCLGPHGGEHLLAAGLGSLIGTKGSNVRVLGVELPGGTSAARMRKLRARRAHVTDVTSRDAEVTQEPSPDRHIASHVTVCDAETVTCDVLPASESLSSPSVSSSQISEASERAIAAAQLDAQALARETWAAARAEHEELRAGNDDVQAWPRKPLGTAARLLAGVVCDLLEAYDDEGARALVRRRTAAAVAEARAKRTLEWFTPTQFFRQFWDGVERSIVRPPARDPPRAGAPPSSLPPPETVDFAGLRADLSRYLETS